MTEKEFAELCKDALTVSAQANVMSVKVDPFFHRIKLHVLDKDDKLWLIEIREP